MVKHNGFRWLYPGWALIVAAVAIIAGLSSISSIEYGDDESLAMWIDFLVAVVISFAFWYAIVLAIGAAARRFGRPRS